MSVVPDDLAELPAELEPGGVVLAVIVDWSPEKNSRSDPGP